MTSYAVAPMICNGLTFPYFIFLTIISVASNPFLIGMLISIITKKYPFLHSVQDFSITFYIAYWPLTAKSCFYYKPKVYNKFYKASILNSLSSTIRIWLCLHYFSFSTDYLSCYFLLLKNTATEDVFSIFWFIISFETSGIPNLLFSDKTELLFNKPFFSSFFSISFSF